MVVAQAVLELLVVLGLADERTRRQVARVLMQLMPDAELQTRKSILPFSCCLAIGPHKHVCVGIHCLPAGILPWAFWIRLYESDPQVTRERAVCQGPGAAFWLVRTRQGRTATMARP